MESVNTAPSDVESQPLLGADKPKSNFHRHVYGKRKRSILDTVALVIYLLHLIGMIVLSVFVFRRKVHDHANSVEQEFRWFIFFAGLTAIVSLLLSPLILLVSYLNVVFLICWDAFLMLGGSIAMVVASIKFLTVPFIIPICILAIFGFFFGAFVAYYSFKLRVHLNPKLKASASIVLHRPASWIINIFTVVVNAAVLGYGLYLIHELLLRYPPLAGILFSILTAISMGWNSLVVSYIGYVTCSGSFASWYFSFNPNAEERYPNGTLKAFLRSLTVSLGSIVIGSFLLSVVLVLKGILKLFKKCESCGEKASKKLSKYVNEYTMIFMALNGNSFLQASKEAKKIVEANVDPAGVTGVLLIGHALGFAATCAFVTLLVSGLHYQEPDFYGMDRYLYFFLLSIAILLCTAWLAWTSVAPQIAAINTTFVCYTLDPTPFPHTPPTIYNSLKATFQTFSKKLENKPAVAKTTTAKASTAKTTIAKTSTAKVSTAKTTTSKATATTTTTEKVSTANAKSANTKVATTNAGGDTVPAPTSPTVPAPSTASSSTDTY